MPLLGEQLAERVGDVHDVDVGGIQACVVECRVDDLGGQLGEAQAFAVEVAGEVALIAAEDPHIRRAHATHATTTNGVTREKRPRRLRV